MNQELRPGSVQARKKVWNEVGDWSAVVLALMLFVGMIIAMVSVLLGHAE